MTSFPPIASYKYLNKSDSWPHINIIMKVLSQTPTLGGPDAGGMEYPDFSSDCQVRRRGQRGSCTVGRSAARGDEELARTREEASGGEGCGRGEVVLEAGDDAFELGRVEGVEES